MHLVQLLLPLEHNSGRRVDAELFSTVRREMVEQFGGITAFTRSPASGLWQEEPGVTVHDDIVVYEVMVPQLDGAWWRSYRQRLEERFDQQAIVIRAQVIELL
jgi:hypothetical protein